MADGTRGPVRLSMKHATPPDRSHLSTEKRNPRTMALHRASVDECIAMMQREDKEAVQAVRRAGKRLSRFISAAEPGFVAGGRLVYVGAGTSGRLGVLDASEAPPTFCVPPGRVVGVIAGGDGALRKSSEGAEDDPRGAWPDLAALSLGGNDAVIAIAAGGTTPYAVGVFEFCAGLPDGARPVTALLCCVQTEAPAGCDHVVSLRTGPEALTGSTRLKAGTATKLALNTISTTLMVRSGRVYENLMVDVRATNDKLRDRAARIIATLTGLSRAECFLLLERAGGEVKTAVVMHRLGADAAGARAQLDACGGRLGEALGELPGAP